MQTTISSKYQVVIPKQARENLHLKPQQKLKYIAENMPYSMNSFILEKLTGDIEEEIDRLST